MNGRHLVRERVSGRGITGTVLRRPRWWLLLWTLLTIVAAVLAGGATGTLKTGGFDDPASESVLAQQALQQHFATANPNLVVLVHGRTSVDSDPAARQVAQTITSRVREIPGAQLIGSYAADPTRSLVSRQGNEGLVLVHLPGDDDASSAWAKQLRKRIPAATGDLDVRFGGTAATNNDINAQVTVDLSRAESLAIPLTMLLLVFVFGSVVAALIPLVVGVVSILMTLAALTLLGSVTNVSIFAVNLATALGLGLAVDYALLLVSRFRTELRDGRDVPQAVVATGRSAGRAVTFSAATVAAALSSLLVFPQYFLKSFAYTGLAVVGVSWACAVTLVPALLLVFGTRLAKVGMGRRRQGRHEELGDLWGRVAAWAMRHPARAAVPLLAALAFLALPTHTLQTAIPDARALPTSTQSRAVAEAVADRFPGTPAGSVFAVAPAWGKGAAADSQLQAYAKSLSTVAGVSGVDSAVGTYARGARVAAPTTAMRAAFRADAATWLRVRTAIPAYSTAGAHFANAVRAVQPPGGRDVLVGGDPASLVDINASMTRHLPWAALLIIFTTYIALLLMTGSAILPIKALVLNGVNLVAVIGVAVWGFQHGHLATLLGFSPTPLAVAVLVLLGCVTFGLSMDYEVIVLAQITELHRAGGSLQESVVGGVSRGGRIISSAALVLCISFFAMLVSGVSFIKLFGLCTGLSILVDALLIRPFLVPSFMRLAGRLNWWAPPWWRLVDRRLWQAVPHPHLHPAVPSSPAEPS